MIKSQEAEFEFDCFWRTEVRSLNEGRIIEQMALRVLKVKCTGVISR